MAIAHIVNCWVDANYANALVRVVEQLDQPESSYQAKTALTNCNGSYKTLEELRRDLVAELSVTREKHLAELKRPFTPGTTITI